MTHMQSCTRCGVKKQLSAFPFKRDGSMDRSAWCVRCKSVRDKPILPVMLPVMRKEYSNPWEALRYD